MTKTRRVAQLVADEPVGIGTLVRVTLALGVAYGLNLTGEQVAVTVTFAEVWSLWWTRRRTRPDRDEPRG